MRIYDESTPRRTIWCAQINWSRELTFSERQINYIMATVPHAREVYCIYAKRRTFAHETFGRQNRRWSRVVYIGSGWLDDRLCAHLKLKKNDLLASYLAEHELAYRFDRIEHSDVLDWPRRSKPHCFGSSKMNSAACREPIGAVKRFLRYLLTGSRFGNHPILIF
jgi:hypothetical protein